MPKMTVICPMKYTEMDCIGNAGILHTEQKNTFHEYKSVVHLLEELIYPDNEKTDWKQTYLLRELKKIINDSIAIKDK